MDYDSGPAQRAVVALAEAWSATVVHMLAREPHTFDELYDAIPGLSRRCAPLYRSNVPCPPPRSIAADPCTDA